MADLETSTPRKSIALIHNSALPSPLGVLSTRIAEDCRVCYCSRREITIHVLDVADFNIPSFDTNGQTIPMPAVENEPPQSKRPLLDWQAEISKHNGFIFLFPFHIWSHCIPLKAALSSEIFPPSLHVLANKPALLAGFGKEDIWHPVSGLDGGWTQRSFSRKSFPMMREWAEGRKMNVMAPRVFQRRREVGDERDGEEELIEFWPEFSCFRDYWEAWEREGRVIIGGQQSESWESSGWNRCQEGMKAMVEMLQRKDRKSGRGQ
jgi:hypothetical protein